MGHGNIGLLPRTSIFPGWELVQPAFTDRWGKISWAIFVQQNDERTYLASACGASLAISCCAAFQVAPLTYVYLSNSNTESFPLLFHSHRPVFCSWQPPYLLVLIILFIFFMCLLLYSLATLLPTSAFPPSCPAFYSAAPLTSAGIIPIMQSLCPDGQRDEFGFLQYKNST